MPKALGKINGRMQVEEMEVDENSLEKASKVEWDTPLSGMVYGTLLNYQGTLDQMGDTLHHPPYQSPPKAPILYIKPRNTFIGHQAAIPLPDDVEELETGACLGVVIGREAKWVEEERALDYVLGYTVVNDISVPHSSVFRPAVKDKSRDGFCPAGPWIMEKGAVTNPDDLTIQVFVNGEKKQENNTSNLVRSVSRLLAEVSGFMTLDQGDTLLVGIPENPPHVKAGDHIRIHIEQVGTLENVVRRESMSGRGSQ
ncbi:fumarylacetoacetate hydrolase family protein [Halobacillus rhizosphaerae]|uniref:fumarylacetoacetate hydrolase family protein n=1 Tax=Halobacillus rhizosphaerae TaxID=3064889 RepID=UPI00398B4752